MDETIELLKEKNKYLEKFYTLNENEILNFSEGNFDNLETFYENRAVVLEMIQSVDRRMEAANLSDIKVNDILDGVKKAVLTELSFKNEIVQRILAQDLQALSYIESAKSDIIKELTKVRAVRKAVGTYHSGIRETIIDEEI